MVLDILVLILFVASTALAFFRGFIRESITILGLGLAMAAAYIGGPLLAPVVAGWMGVQEGVPAEKLMGILPMDMLAKLLASGGLFILVSIIFSIVSHLLAETIKSMGLGAVDRSLGALFGFLRAGLIAILLYFPVYYLLNDQTKHSWFDSSKSFIFLEKSVAYMSTKLPDNFIQNQVDKAESITANPDVQNTAREKLQEMNLLPDGLSNEEAATLMRKKYESGELQESLKQGGYSEDFRNTLDALIENNIDADIEKNLNE